MTGADPAGNRPAAPPLRSVLYLPGSNQRALAKARTLAADALILDLEDAVAPDAKQSAREQVAAAVTAGGYGRRHLTIRINGQDTPWYEADLRMVATVAPRAVVVPKVATAQQLREVESGLRAAGAPPEVAIWAMVETAQAVLRVAEIAVATPRLAALVLGTNDLAAELRVEPTPGRAPLSTSISLCVLAARAAGIAVLDGVFNDLGDPDGLAAECAQGRQFGMDGKTLIHPSQIAPCNAAFAPDPAALERARRIIAAFDEARRRGQGVITVDGRLVEALHVAQAQRLLALDAAIAAAAEPPTA